MPASLRALRGEEIADTQGEPEPARIASRGISGMLRRVEDECGEDGRRKVLEGRRGFQFPQSGGRLRRLETSLYGGHPRFHQTIVASRQRA